MQVLTSPTLYTLTVSGFLLALFSACAAQEIPHAATEDNRRIADTQSNEGERFKLPPNALQMARIIGVESRSSPL